MKHDKEKEIIETGLRFFPDSWGIIGDQALCAVSRGDSIEANEYIAKFKSISKESGRSEAAIESNLGFLYSEANIINKAEKHYRNAYKLEPQNISRILGLSQFLINNDINIDEGMELAQKGLDIQPDNLFLLWVKGRGLFKQGNYEEAVQLLKSVQEKSDGFNYDLYQHLQEAEQALANKNK